jgi:CRP-like cAMP-binding protein
MDAFLRSPNRLLAALPAADFEQIRPYLQTTELVAEAVLVRADEPLTHVFFPHSGVISLVVSLTSGETVEVAMIGCDSVYGATASLDGRISLTDAVVQLPGITSTLEAGRLRTAANQSVAFRTTLIRHEQALFAQAQQTAACNASHPVHARLARWLLRMNDLSGDDALHLTQAFLAQMIGVERNSVSVVAHKLQQAGIIRYSRGLVEIIDLKALHDVSCECYEAVRAQYGRLMGVD